MSLAVAALDEVAKGVEAERLRPDRTAVRARRPILSVADQRIGPVKWTKLKSPTYHAA